MEEILKFKEFLKYNEKMINELEACQLLGITKRTLSNYVYSGRIPVDFYSVGVGGNKFFYKNKLMGLK